MRFPLLDRLDLPCVFEQLVPGQPHPDGRRYLPLIVLRPTGSADELPPGLRLGVVDRHHRVAEGDAGRLGSARLVCALSSVRLQEPPGQLGLRPEPGWRGGVSTRPLILGRVVEVATWEVERGQLPFERLYTELSLDVGFGVIGMRTSLTASSVAGALGKARIEPGDYLELSRSRIDILGFTPREG